MSASTPDRSISAARLRRSRVLRERVLVTRLDMTVSTRKKGKKGRDAPEIKVAGTETLKGGGDVTAKKRRPVLQTPMERMDIGQGTYVM